MRSDRIEKVAVDQLDLDRDNPRLIGDVEDPSDEGIIALLYEGSRLDELIQSISTNGYLDIEPLIVKPGGADGKLTVMEGNRRLAALRLLREPGLIDRIEKTTGTRIPVPPMPASRRATLNRVSVYQVDSREQARSFIGFKHINGPARWNAYAKARFVAAWYREQRENGLSLNDIADAIGDKHDTVKRMVFAIYVLDQAEREGLYDMEDRLPVRFSFSHLYIALTRSQYMEYLGIETGWSKIEPGPDQIPRNKFKELRNVLVWLHGSRSDDVPSVISSQNPDVKRLGEVLAHAEARNILETTNDLDQAHTSTSPADTRFTMSLIDARTKIQNAAGAIGGYDGSDRSLLDISEHIKVLSTMVNDQMKKKRREMGFVE